MFIAFHNFAMNFIELFPTHDTMLFISLLLICLSFAQHCISNSLRCLFVEFILMSLIVLPHWNATPAVTNTTHIYPGARNGLHIGDHGDPALFSRLNVHLNGNPEF